MTSIYIAFLLGIGALLVASWGASPQLQKMPARQKKKHYWPNWLPNKDGCHWQTLNVIAAFGGATWRSETPVFRQ